MLVTDWRVSRHSVSSDLSTRLSFCMDLATLSRPALTTSGDLTAASPLNSRLTLAMGLSRTLKGDLVVVLPGTCGEEVLEVLEEVSMSDLMARRTAAAAVTAGEKLDIL